MFHECHYILERVHFSPDLTKIAIATFDHSIRVDKITKECKIEQTELIFKYHTQKIIMILFSNDGNKLVTLGMDKILIFWDINEQTFLFKLKPENENFKSLRFSHNDRLFAAGTEDSLLMLWDLTGDSKRGKLKHLFQDHKKSITSLDFSRNDQLLCSGSEDKVIIMHSVETGEVLQIFKDHFDAVTSLCFSPTDNTFVSGGRDKKVILWDADTKSKILEFRNRAEEIIHILYSPDGEQIYSVDKDCKIYAYNREGNVILGPLKEHEKKIETIGFMKEFDGRYTLVTGSRDKMIIKWDVYTGKILRKPLGKYPTKKYNSFSMISPDNLKMITITNPSYNNYNNTLMTKWKAGSGIPDDKIEYQNINFTLMAFSSNPDGFAAATKDRKVYIWKISNIKTPFSVIDDLHSDDITALAYYSDKNLEILATGSNDKTISLWNITKEKKICENMEGHQSAISIIKFSKDGLRMASYSNDLMNTITIWDPATGKRLFGLNEHLKDPIMCIKFSVDSSKMACGSKYGSIYIYQVTNTSKWKLCPLILQVNDGPITTLAFTKYNNKIATACNLKNNNEINVWDYSTGELQIGPLIGHHYEVTSMTFSREDSVLTSFSKDSLKSWRFFNKSSEKSYPIDGTYIYDVSLDGSKILGKNPEKNEVLIYNATDFSAEFNQLENSSKELKFFNFSSDGLLCLGGDKIAITVWNVKTGEIKQKIKDMVRSFVCGRFTQKADIIATGSFSGSVTLWSLEKGKEICTFSEKHKGEVMLLCFSTDDSYLATSDSKNRIFVWDVAKRMKIYEMMEHETRIISLEMSFDGTSMCSISEDRNIKLWSFLNADNRMRELDKLIKKNKKISVLKFSLDWNMYCIILENRKKIEFYETKEKVPIKVLEFQSPILKVYWSKNNDVFLVFPQEFRCYMHFLNRELMFLEKGLKICEFYKDPEKFSTSDIQKIIDGNDGKIIPFSYSFLQIVAYTNDYKSFFSGKLLPLLQRRGLKISSHAFFDKDIHGNSCIDIILKKKEKSILKMIFKYIIKQYTIKDLFREDYYINMTLLYKLLKIFGQDTYIIDKLLKMSFDSPERFPEAFNYKELPEPLYRVRNNPQITKTEIKPLLNNHIKECTAKGYTASKFKTKMQVKCVYISDILNENNPSTLMFFKNICKLNSTNKIFENEVLAKVISYKWESEGSKDFFQDGLSNLTFLLLYLLNALLIFPNRSPDSSDFEVLCYISFVCDAILYVFLFYQGYQEAQQCYKLSLKHYISSIWNVNDVTRIVSGITSTTMDINSCFFNELYVYAKACHSITIFVCFIKLISFARGIKNSAFIVRLIIQVFLDIRSFLFIVFIFIFALGFSVFTIQMEFTSNPLESFNIFFRNMLGDFTDFDELSVINTTMLYVFFMVGSVLVTIILLNLLIAIICDTYKKVSKNERFTRVYEMCSILYETDIRELTANEKDDDSKFLFYISNHSDKNEKEKLYDRLKRKLKENNFAFIDKFNALEQRMEQTIKKDRRMSRMEEP